jgi:cytochrome c5
MNFGRVALGSALFAFGSCVLLLASQPVFAKANPPVATIRWEFAAASQEQQKKVFPKVDPKDEIPLPDGEGKDVTKRVCGNCHSTNIWIKQRHSAEKWSSIIDNMVSKGMEASDDDLATVNDYLGKYLAPPPKDAPPATPAQ